MLLNRTINETEELTLQLREIIENLIVDEKVDTFVDMRGFTNAIVYINGFNLGRFLKRGPQYTLYLPAPFLKDENELVILELEGTKKKSVSLIDKPILK